MRHILHRVVSLALVLLLLVGMAQPAHAVPVSYESVTRNIAPTASDTTEPSIPREPTEPTDPSEPVEPTEPGEPTVPVTSSPAEDTQPPVIAAVVRQGDGWTTKASLVITVTDDSNEIAGVTVVSENGTQSPAEEQSGGTYLAMIHENGDYIIFAEDAAGNFATAQYSESHIDTEPPVISEIVRSTDGWTQAAEYTFRIADMQSGIKAVTLSSESSEIVTTLTPDENGIYHAALEENTTYLLRVEDKAGNSESHEFSEDHIDTTAPEIGQALRSPDTWAQEAIYRFTVTDAASGVASVKVFFDETELPISKIGSVYSVRVAANGAYKITALDSVGNQSELPFTEESIDTDAPVIVSVTPQDQWDTEKNTVTIVVNDVSEELTVRITDTHGRQFSTDRIDNSTYCATLPENGSYTVTVTDTAGNTAAQTFTISHIDTEAPSVPTLQSSADTWVNTDVTLTAVSSDAQSGVSAYWYSTVNAEFNAQTWTRMDTSDVGGTLLLTQEQDNEYYIVAQDAVGHISEPAHIHVSIDKTAPDQLNAAFLLGEDSGYCRTVDGVLIYRDKLSFRAAAQDTASGVVRYEYHLAGNDSESGWITVEAGEEGFSDTFAGMNGTYRFFVRAVDLAGNVSEEVTVWKDGEIQLAILENTPKTDAEKSAAPALTMNDGSYTGAWTNEDVTICVLGTDAPSGTEYFEYRVDHADPTLADTDWQRLDKMQGKAYLTVSSDTNAVYFFRAITFAGNETQTSCCTVRIQKTVPMSADMTQDAPTGAHGWYTVLPSYAITLPEQNPYFAPVHYEIVCAHGDQTQTLTYDGTNAPVISADGFWRIAIRAVDSAGNESATAACSFSVDTQSPTAPDVLLDGVSISNFASPGIKARENVNFWDIVLDSDFTIFENGTVTVSARADGGDSGLDTIYYQITPDARPDRSGTWELLGEGIALSPDRKCHLYFKAVDMAGNVTYFSGKSILLDQQPPILTVQPTNENLSKHGIYYNTVTVTLHAEDDDMGSIFAGLKSVSYTVTADGIVTQSGQLYPGTGSTTAKDGRILTWDGSIQIDADANNSNHVVVTLTATDMAGNTATLASKDGDIRIDRTAPSVSASYDRNDPISEYEDTPCFTGSRVLTLTVTERNFLPAASFVRVVDTDTGRTESYTWQQDVNGTYRAVVTVADDGHYTVSADITDAAGNRTEQIVFAQGTVAEQKFIIDNTAPEISVQYDNNDARQETYFAAGRTAIITVTERNFDPEQITVQARFVAEDGTVRLLHPNGWITDGNTHTAYLTCSRSGVYSVSVSGTDALGNKANVGFFGAAVQEFTVDLGISAPEFSFVADGQAYAGSLIPVVTALDANLDEFTVTMTRTRKDEIGSDVTALLSGCKKEEIDGGAKMTLDVFPMEQATDGHYTLSVCVTDKAGNKAENTITFYANRYGSVYVYDEYLSSIMDAYLTEVTGNLILTEYNPSAIVPDTARLQITRDGTPLANVGFTAEPTVAAQAKSGWYEYRYVISAQNFAQDGVYGVTVSTVDTAGNLPENTSEDTAIRFSVDTTPPDLSSVVGMEMAIYNVDTQEVLLTVNDNIALESVVVYLNGEPLVAWRDLTDYALNETFQIPAGLNQHIRIVAQDKAGNVLDTDADGFAPGYAFHRTVTVSTNFFLRWFANKPAFYGSIGGAAALGSIIAAIVLKKKKAKK